MFNVKDMYGYSNTHHTPLLSNLDKPWWSEYIENFDEYDNVFKNLFKSFIYYDQELDDELANVTARFTKAVKDWLYMNDKRYDELWRVNVVNDNKYDILDNYNVTETYTGLDTTQSANKEGARTDVRDFTEGNQTFENQNSVSAFNSNNSSPRNTEKNESGTRNDVEAFTKGEMQSTFASNEGSSHTLNRKGNIGVRTQTEVMEKHSNYWEKYNFYMFIFNEINDNFLLV